MTRSYGRLTGVAIGILLVAGLISACDTTDLTGGPPPEDQRPVAAIFVDISRSTDALRQPGGEFEEALLEANDLIAPDWGYLYVSAADSNTIGNSQWYVEHKFEDEEQNNNLAEESLLNQAEELQPALKAVVQKQAEQGGSDLLGALGMASRLFASTPDNPKNLVLMSDGDINTASFHLNEELPMSPSEMDQRISQLKASGDIPDLSEGGQSVRVWLGGLGYGLPSAEKSEQIIEFWEKLIPAAGGEVMTADSTIRLPEFP
jgi:hypothetical protein